MSNRIDYDFFDRDRNTKKFWKQVRCSIFSMFQQYLILDLSFSECLFKVLFCSQIESSTNSIASFCVNSDNIGDCKCSMKIMLPQLSYIQLQYKLLMFNFFKSVTLGVSLFSNLLCPRFYLLVFVVPPSILDPLIAGISDKSDLSKIDYTVTSYYVSIQKFQMLHP